MDFYIKKNLLNHFKIMGLINYGIHRYVNYITVKTTIHSVVLTHIYMSHSITVLSEVFFIRNLCLIRDDYTAFDNCAITKKSCIFFN